MGTSRRPAEAARLLDARPSRGRQLKDASARVAVTCGTTIGGRERRQSAHKRQQPRVKCDTNVKCLAGQSVIATLCAAGSGPAPHTVAGLCGHSRL